LEAGAQSYWDAGLDEEEIAELVRAAVREHARNTERRTVRPDAREHYSRAWWSDELGPGDDRGVPSGP
jgi:hypothetical protein